MIDANRGYRGYTRSIRSQQAIEEYLDTQEEINESTDIILFRFRTEQAYKKVFPNAPGNVETYHAAIAAIYLIYYTQGYNITVLWDNDPVYSIHTFKNMYNIDIT